MNPFHYGWKLIFIMKATVKEEKKKFQNDKECLSQLKDKKVH